MYKISNSERTKPRELARAVEFAATANNFLSGYIAGQPDMDTEQHLP